MRSKLVAFHIEPLLYAINKPDADALQVVMRDIHIDRVTYRVANNQFELGAADALLDIAGTMYWRIISAQQRARDEQDQSTPG